jgi:hypothetical protein
MLTIEIPESEFFFEETSEFKQVKGYILQLEHSLVSLSKWESKWKKPFLNSEKTIEESVDYIRCMTINHNVPDYVYKVLTDKHMQMVTDYISDPMTATTFREIDKQVSREIITSELIYYWMIAQQIPFECRKWHLNTLLTLIRVCAVKSAPPKKMNKQAIMNQNRAINNARKARLNSRG